MIECKHQTFHNKQDNIYFESAGVDVPEPGVDALGAGVNPLVVGVDAPDPDVDSPSAEAFTFYLAMIAEKFL